MDEPKEVKKKRSWAFRAFKWLLLTVGIVVAGGITAANTYQFLQRRTVHATAALPVRERNLAVFDAACEILKSHYYNPDYFKTDDWRAYEASWREKAAASQPGTFLYINVLGNFAGNFPDSHVGFEQAQAPEAPAAAGESKTLPAVPGAMTAADWDQRLRIFTGSPGFDVVIMRRGAMTLQMVGDVVRGSAAERAGIAPGWGLPSLQKTMRPEGVQFRGTFLELTGAAAQELERSGHPPGALSAGPRDPYTLEHGVEHEFTLEALPGREPFEKLGLANGVTYLRFDTFLEGHVVNPVLDVIDGAGPNGLVLDLRHNTGGMMLYLQRFLGHLLGNDVNVGTLRDHDSSSAMRTWRWGASYQGPVVVLIGPETTSAAEIAAATIQDLKRGKLIGRMTNGSVLNSKKYNLPDGGVMTVPIRDFYRTDGRRIEGIGVEPDIRVVPTLEDVRADRDPVLEKALELLAAGQARQAKARS